MYIRAYVLVYTRICARINIRVYAKYARIIRVCVVRIYLSCTVRVTDAVKKHYGQYCF